MNTTIKPKETIFEFNKSVLLDAKCWLPELNQSTENSKKISIKLDFHSYSDIGLHIDSLLNAVINADENELKREPIMFQYVAGLSSRLMQSLPLEFLDKLLIKERHNTDNFTNLKDL
ncbi:hypothetical protein [Flavobacterium psychrophilum]|uniref:hypothetical protein n=1 Tax=Flavobacterium psychrophilum TaxID=96345 RepID=UPI000B7C33D5|nr:hypothetical protein [Flavobacterium psychrophilum]MCB6089455.1 hypothetical protein [Flavobacterium psychrophilum]MCB6232070.1 hypothetical protein [Flavobacterium psychrophilum]SNA80294.1 hypothetical protein FI146_340006 [Flavobacterium psychrophilum]SNB13517.1 hypothetical protein JIP1600_2250003 [Flavobacterium psychrophilum]